MYGRVCQSVPEPIVELVDSQTDAALSPDRVLYYRIGSSLELHCRVQRYWVKPLRFHWLKSGKPVSDDIWRGGIRSCTIRTSLFIQSVCWPSSPETGSNILLHEGQSLWFMDRVNNFSAFFPAILRSIYTETTKPGQLDSKLSIANATINDSGNYTCSLDTFSVSTVVHFLKGTYTIWQLLVAAAKYWPECKAAISHWFLWAEEKQAASQHAANGGSLMLPPPFKHGLARHLFLWLLIQHARLLTWI